MKTRFFYSQRYSFNKWRYIKNDNLKKLRKECVPADFLERLTEKGDWYMYNEWLAGHDNL